MKTPHSDRISSSTRQETDITIWTVCNCEFLLFLCVCFLTQQPPPQWARASSFMRFLDHTQRHIKKSVGLLWTSDQLVAETSTWQRTTLTIDIHAFGGIRTHDLSKRAAADLRLRPRGHWDRQCSRSLQNLPNEPLRLVCTGVRFVDIFVVKFCTASFCFLFVR